MIIGIGNDLADVRRIGEVLDKHGERFIARCYTPVERERAERAEASERAASYAKRWAAKEACAKALGSGLATPLGREGGILMQDIGVINLSSGQPVIEVSGTARDRLLALTPEGMSPHIHLSLADEPPFAQAFVVISAA